MSHPDRKKQKQRKREEMLKFKNEFGKPDPTPFEAVLNIINECNLNDNYIEALRKVG